MKQVLLLHAPNDAARAEEIASLLETQGYGVEAKKCNGGGAGEQRRLSADVRAASNVLVLWSNGATPSLRITAARAKKPVIARLDTAPAPPRLKAETVALPRGRNQALVLKRLLEKSPVTYEQAIPATNRTNRFGGVLALLVLCLVTAGAVYAVNPSFAAHVDAITGQATALVHAKS